MGKPTEKPIAFRPKPELRARFDAYAKANNMNANRAAQELVTIGLDALERPKGRVRQNTTDAPTEPVVAVPSQMNVPLTAPRQPGESANAYYARKNEAAARADKLRALWFGAKPEKGR
jgi:predicted phage gp36 major capsid-like protein